MNGNNEILFTKESAALGLVSYLVLAAIVFLVFI